METELCCNGPDQSRGVMGLIVYRCRLTLTPCDAAPTGNLGVGMQAPSERIRLQLVMHPGGADDTGQDNMGIHTSYRSYTRKILWVSSSPILHADKLMTERETRGVDAGTFRGDRSAAGHGQRGRRGYRAD